MARAVGTTEFGAFGIAIATYVLLMGALRGLVGEPLIVRFSTAAKDERLAAAASAASAALGIGALSGAVVAVAVVVGLRGDVGASMLALAVCLPGLALQDTWRYGLFVLGRPRSAAVNDGLWILFQIVAIALLFSRSNPGAPALLLAWGLAGSCAGACGFVQARPSKPLIWRWWAWPLEHRDLGGRYLTEFLASAGTGQLALYGLGILSGLTAVAAVRGTLTLLGPVSILYTGVTITAIMEGGRLRDDSRRLNRMLKLVCLVLVLSTSVWVVILLALPLRVGRNLLGASWVSARAVLLVMGVSYILNGLTTGGIVGLRVRRDAVRSLRARLQLLPLALGLPTLGGALRGQSGFAAGSALSALAAVGIWWYQYARSYRSSASRATEGARLSSGK